MREKGNKKTEEQQPPHRDARCSQPTLLLLLLCCWEEMLKKRGERLASWMPVPSSSSRRRNHDYVVFVQAVSMNYCMREKRHNRSRPFNVFGIMMEMPQAKEVLSFRVVRSWVWCAFPSHPRPLPLAEGKLSQTQRSRSLFPLRIVVLPLAPPPSVSSSVMAGDAEPAWPKGAVADQRRTLLTRRLEVILCRLAFLVQVPLALGLVVVIVVRLKNELFLPRPPRWGTRRVLGDWRVRLRSRRLLRLGALLPQRTPPAARSSGTRTGCGSWRTWSSRGC